MDNNSDFIYKYFKFIDKLNNYVFISTNNEYDEFIKNFDVLGMTNIHLCFSGDFNYPINNLPNGIKKIDLGYYFNQPIDNLPSGLESLSLGKNFNQPLDNLPYSLKLADVYCYQSNKILDNLPKSVKYLQISNFDNKYPFIYFGTHKIFIDELNKM